MSILRKIIPVAMALAGISNAHADRVLDLPMDISGQSAVSAEGRSFTVSDQFGAMKIAGADGHAWRTDGHTSFMTADVGNLLDGNAMTAQVTFAIDTNVIISHDDEGAEGRWARFVDCINGNTGFAFALGRRGQFAFQVYVGGTLVTLESDVNADNGKLQLWQWNTLTGVVDGGSVRLYLNGVRVADRNVGSQGVKVAGSMMLGRDRNINDLYCGNFRVGDFNGAIDCLRIDNSALTPAVFTPSYADLNLPASRYDGDRLRARFHGQPGMNWTNETHGLMYNEKDGKYHVIFQRTGSVPGMSHAHYGHIVSSDLFNWSDDKPMIWPSEQYDRRGCWSGCLFTDSKINNGKPAIIYTGVEYGALSHANIAFCDDDVNLRSWHKSGLGNPIKNYGNMARDTYFFRVDDNNAYFIIGDDGHMKSYRYNDNGSWSDNGHFYDFQPGESGFTEMPNVARLPNGRWLMTFTPYTGSVKCIYRIGDIDGSGRFVNFTDSQLFDFYAFDGFCLMSPSIGRDKYGNLIALGIVADKMPTEWNMAKGYAHLYSLPRELGVDAEGRLTQKPFRDHEKMFGSVSYELSAPETLVGAKALNPVRGRQAEVCASFRVGTVPFGINFLKDENGRGGKVTYNPADHTLSLDISPIVGGGYGMKNASYTLPVYPGKGETLKLQLFIDHSIVDLFVNDRYATSFRVFPESMDHDLIEVFSNGPTVLESLSAHMLGDGDMRDTPIVPEVFSLPENSGKVAFVKAPSGISPQEQAACDYFEYVLGNRNVVLTSDLAAIDASKYDCLWVHIDRIGLSAGAAALPDCFRDKDFVAKLARFVDNGGNLYLSGQATQILELIGRIPAGFAPNVFNSGSGAMGSDEWTVNPCLADKYNHETHPLFNKMKKSDAFQWTTYGLLKPFYGSILREDHNCMWSLSEFEYSSEAEDNVRKFELDNAASVIGTWGQDRSDSWAGIVEFYPYPVDKERDVWSGSIIANGLAACQWSVDGSGNADLENLQLMTANAFSYLANKDGKKPENPKITGNGGTVTPPDDPGVKVETLESTGRVALYLGYSSTDEFNNTANQYYEQDHMIYDSFRAAFPEGRMLLSGDAGLLKPENFDCVWVHCDRKNIQAGWENLPKTFTDFVEPLKNYSKAGGNLYLSKMASQLVVAIGRTDQAPDVFSSGDGGVNADDWTMNIAHHENADWSEHILFSGMEYTEADYGKLILLCSGKYHRDDHNCMWEMPHFEGHDAFCARNNARVLGTWGHDGGQEYAGMIEFMPSGSASAQMRIASPDVVNARKGTVIVNGIAGVEFNPGNTAVDNLRKMSANILSYLSPVPDMPTGTDGFECDEDASETTYYTLQGIRLDARPERGLYIERRGNSVRKVMVR